MACAVRSDNTIVCFGTGSWTVSGANYASVSVGAAHACAITTDGALTCWGEDREGQVSTAPTAPVFQRCTQVNAGTVHSCAVLDDGSLECWGNNQFGEINVATLPAGVRYTRRGRSATTVGDLSQAKIHNLCTAPKRRSRHCHVEGSRQRLAVWPR